MTLRKLCLNLFSVLLFCGYISCNVWTSSRGEQESECLDVAIVGGGIGGTYTAWKLRNQELKVGIFENTNRIGGRTFTTFLPSVPNVPIDLGAMRYIPGVHTVLETLLQELGIETTVFQPDVHDKLFYLRGKRLSFYDLLTDQSPYNLEPNESRHPGELHWSLSQRALNVSNPDEIPDIEECSTPDGIPIYQQGYLSLMGDIWSNEAKEYIKAMGGFSTMYEPNMNAVHDIVATNPSKPKIRKRMVAGGMGSIAYRLAREFIGTSLDHKIQLNSRVGSIRRSRNGRSYVYKLTVHTTKTLEGRTSDTTDNMKTICAKKVILALPRRALQNVLWYPLQKDPRVKDAFNSVIEYTALKIFLAYPEAWWDKLGSKNFRAFVTDIPLRQGGEFGRFWNSSGHETAVLMASYTDGETNNDYWRELRRFPEAFAFSGVPEAFSVSTRVLKRVHHHLGAIYGIDAQDIPQPIDGVMHIWADPQNGGGWQRYNPGYKPKVVSNFMQRPSRSDDVFIVTNSFSRDFSTWIEGSLRAADEVLTQHFNLF